MILGGPQTRRAAKPKQNPAVPLARRAFPSSRCPREAGAEKVSGERRDGRQPRGMASIAAGLMVPFFAGAATSLAISNAYYPDGRTVGNNLGRYAVQLGFDAASNVLKEFWPDLKRTLPRRLTQ